MNKETESENKSYGRVTVMGYTLNTMAHWSNVFSLTNHEDGTCKFFGYGGVATRKFSKLTGMDEELIDVYLALPSFDMQVSKIVPRSGSYDFRYIRTQGCLSIKLGIGMYAFQYVFVGGSLDVELCVSDDSYRMSYKFIRDNHVVLANYVVGDTLGEAGSRLRRDITDNHPDIVKFLYNIDKEL